jgi:hypothetical protein
MQMDSRLRGNDNLYVHPLDLHYKNICATVGAVSTTTYRPSLAISSLAGPELMGRVALSVSSRPGFFLSLVEN